MRRRTDYLNRIRHLMPGWIAFVGLVGIVLMALGGLLMQAPAINLAQIFSDGEISRILRYTLLQAGLFCLVSALRSPLPAHSPGAGIFWAAACLFS